MTGSEPATWICSGQLNYIGIFLHEDFNIVFESTLASIGFTMSFFLTKPLFMCKSSDYHKYLNYQC